jgi:hypothetical protein
MKPLIVVLLFILMIGCARAEELACQYQVNEIHTETVANIHNGDQVLGPALVFDSFAKAEGGYDSFKIHNPLSIDITIQVEYTQILTGAGPTFERYGNSAEVTIPQNDFVTLQTKDAFQNSFLNYETHIDTESIKYTIISPSGLTVQNDIINKSIPVCRLCLGKQCLNDKQVCSNDLECGSGICSIGNYCDKTRVVDCPSGTLNCLNKSCLAPGTKGLDQGYMCGWECASGFGQQGVCKKNPIQFLKDILYWLAGLILLVGAGIIFLQIARKGEIIQSGWRKRGEIIKGAEAKCQQKREQIEELEQVLNDMNYQIHKAKSQSEELNHTKRQQKKVIEEIKYQTRQLKLEKVKLTKEKLKPYRNKQGYLVHLNDDGYEIFENSGKLVHLWVWVQNRGQIPFGYEVHHKDRNKLNNDISNLELMDSDQHKLLHGRT